QSVSSVMQTLPLPTRAAASAAATPPTLPPTTSTLQSSVSPAGGVLPRGEFKSPLLPGPSWVERLSFRGSQAARVRTTARASRTARADLQMQCQNALTSVQQRPPVLEPTGVEVGDYTVVPCNLGGLFRTRPFLIGELREIIGCSRKDTFFAPE